MAGPAIIDPHVHYWDPGTTPHQVTPLVKLFGRWPKLLERMVRRATPTPLVDFVGPPDHVLNAHLPATFLASTGHHDVRGIVHVEAGWHGRGRVAVAGETRWLDQLDPPPLAIIGRANLANSADLEAVLDAHSLASGRLRGIRQSLSAHPAPGVYTWETPGLMGTDDFVAGFASLAERQLSFEAWCYSNQLGELDELLAAAPFTRVMLDHLATPVGLAGPYAGVGNTQAERDSIKAQWREGLQAVAAHSQVHAKLSGLLMPACGFGFEHREKPVSHQELVDAIGEPIMFAIETFGPERCLFASNFPMDKVSVSYEALYDAYIAIAANAGLTPDQQVALFADNAAAFYRLVDDESGPS